MSGVSASPTLRVSVIIPTYNRAGYLQEALESVFAQTLAPWEIIVVDDGSTDDTPEVIKAYEARVRYVRHEQNRRISAARNSGLKAARGDLIAWLDSDDLWEPDFLATVIPLIAEGDSVDGAYTGLVRIDTSGNILPQRSLWSVPSEELLSSLIEGCNIQTSTFVARKHCFDQAGEFDTRFDICEDYDMFLRIARNSRIIGIPRPLVRYRVHAQNTVSDPIAHCRFRLALAEKHFGSPDGNSQTWSDEQRRAHAFAFRAVALKCIGSQQLDKGWQYLQRAVFILPTLLERVDTFYELACGNQPMGYRGHAQLLDIERSETELFWRLDTLLSHATLPEKSLRSIAYSNAYLALAMLSDQNGQWSQARNYMLLAARANPKFLYQYSFVRRILRLCAGQRVVSWWQRLKSSSEDET